MAEVEVVVAHHERVTLRAGDVFLKIDADQARTDVEVAAMAISPFMGIARAAARAVRTYRVVPATEIAAFGGDRSIMKFFLDSVRLHEIDEAVDRGVIAGVTVNPNFLRAEISAAPLAHLRKVIERSQPLDGEIHVQVQTTNPDEMLHWAETVSRELDYPGLVVKIPCGWSELAVMTTIAHAASRPMWSACDLSPVPADMSPGSAGHTPHSRTAIRRSG